MTEEQKRELLEWVAMLETNIRIDAWWDALSWAIEVTKVCSQVLDPTGVVKVND